MNRASLSLLTLAVAAPSLALAGNGSTELGTFSAAETLHCFGKTTDGTLLCDPIASGVVMHQLSATKVRVENQATGVTVELDGTNLVAERGQFSDGGAGMRVRGDIATATATRYDRGVAESVVTLPAGVDMLLDDVELLDLQIDIGKDAVQIDFAESGISMPTIQRARFDRNGLVLGVLVNNENVQELKVNAGGTATLAGARGNVLLSPGGTFVDAFGSSAVDRDESYSWIEVEGAADAGAAGWFIISPRDHASLELHRRGGPYAGFTLTLLDAALDTAVIDGRVYEMRYAEYEE
ncbi:MAG: hypothetical protein Q8P18_27895 [Pseudomonadota bacterium]|nr:hypothetical protein [Pseudomonadota bacterium]